MNRVICFIFGHKYDHGRLHRYCYTNCVRCKVRLENEITTQDIAGVKITMYKVVENRRDGFR